MAGLASPLSNTDESNTDDPFALPRFDPVILSVVFFCICSDLYYLISICICISIVSSFSVYLLIYIFLYLSLHVYMHIRFNSEDFRGHVLLETFFCRAPIETDIVIFLIVLSFFRKAFLDSSISEERFFLFLI